MTQTTTTPSLEPIANAIRQDIIKMLLAAGSGHSAGPLGMADVFTALYFGDVVHHRATEPWWPDRDRVILSNGHICPVWYATLAHAGYFDRSELTTLRKLGSRLQGHPHRGSLPGIENTGGPLGQGLSQALGLAEAARLDGARWRTFCLMSDGEHNEGQTWEAVLYAGKRKLSTMTAILDRNHIQIDGTTETVMPLEPLRAKYEAFNWHVLEVDGHNIPHIIDACREARAIAEQPTLIICHTIPGKGVDFMENDFVWHGKPPNAVEAKQALHELRTLGRRIRGEHE
jgi:transketolase